MTWALHSIFVLYRDHGKVTNKSIKETEGSLIYTFNDSPQRLKKYVTSPKTYTSQEHSHALKLGRDSGTEFLLVRLKCFVLSTVDNFFFPPAQSPSLFSSSH